MAGHADRRSTDDGWEPIAVVTRPTTMRIRPQLVVGVSAAAILVAASCGTRNDADEAPQPSSAPSASRLMDPPPESGDHDSVPDATKQPESDDSIPDGEIEGSAPTTEAPLSVRDLLALPIDELPTSMYSVQPCESVVRSAPDIDPFSDFSDVEYSLEEIADRADIVIHGAVQAVSDPVLIVPAGVPDGFLSATGATSPDQIAFGATSVAISVLDSDPPDLVGPTETTGLLPGCIAESALAATSPGREVLILADVPDPGRGALGITDSEVRVLGWLEVSPKGLLRAHPTTFGTPNPFRALDGMTPREAMERIAEVRPG